MLIQETIFIIRRRFIDLRNQIDKINPMTTDKIHLLLF